MIDFNITIESGESIKLPVAGKVSDNDIIITAEGGAENLDTELTEQERLIEQLKTTLEGKASGGAEPVEPILQEKSVTPTKAVQEVTPDSGYDGLIKVSVGAIPSEYIVPSGTESIVTNGTHDVKSVASVNVNVPTFSKTEEWVFVMESGETVTKVVGIV